MLLIGLFASYLCFDLKYLHSLKFEDNLIPESAITYSIEDFYLTTKRKLNFIIAKHISMNISLLVF